MSDSLAGLAQGDLTPSWMDWVAVDRCIRQRPVGRSLSQAERQAVARECQERGMSNEDIAKRLKCNWSQVPALLNPPAKEQT